MKKCSFVFVKIGILFLCGAVYGQRYQKIAYVDMDYILEQMPIYQKSEKILDEKIKRWEQEIKTQEQEIQNLKNAMNGETNEKIMTIRKKRIAQKQKELQMKKEKYFGEKGLVFKVRSELLQPLQDEIFKAIQNIAKKEKYDFIFDKSESFSVLYANPIYDVSDSVLKKIKKNLKTIRK